MKRFLWSLSVVAILGLINCGGGSSKEAKKMLQRILNLVGIPQTIVVNICQDENRDGICGASELQAKVTIKKGDTVATIWQKITNTEEGKYLLETYDPSLPILLELQDTSNKHYTDKFVIPFNGLESTEEEKDLSILQAMVDAGYLKAEEIAKVKEMENQEEFYANLLEDFEINLKTLTDNNISTQNAVLANIKEIAEELREEGIADKIPAKINDCNNDNSCIKDVLEPVSQEVQIDENETQEIKNVETENTKKLFAGKTFYISYNEDGVATIEKIVFNSEATSLEWEQVYGQDNSGTATVSIEGAIMTTVDNSETEYHKVVSVNDKYIEIEDKDDNSKLYYTFEDAKKELKISGFTKEMLQDAVVYDYAYTEEDGTQGYGKTTFQSDTFAIRHEIAISPEGNVSADESFNLNISLENGVMNFSTDNGSGAWILNSQDSNAWYVTMKMETTEDKTVYLSKPSDFPEGL